MNILIWLALQRLGWMKLRELVFPSFVHLQQQARPERQGVGTAISYQNAIILTSCPVPQTAGLEYLYLKVGLQDRIGILLVYSPLHYTTISLPELAELVLSLIHI